MLNKKDLAKILATKNRTTVKEEIDHIDLVFSTIEELLEENKTVNIVGFGSFQIIQRKPRIRLNPKTQERFKVGEKNVLKFVKGKHLKEIEKKL